MMRAENFLYYLTICSTYYHEKCVIYELKVIATMDCILRYFYGLWLFSPAKYEILRGLILFQWYFK